MKHFIFHSIFVFLFVFAVGCSHNKPQKQSSTTESAATVSLKNPTAFDRTLETVEVPWRPMEKKGLQVGNTIVVNNMGEEVPSQILSDKNGKPLTLLFQTQLKAEENTRFFVKKGKPASYATQVYAKVEPRRYNDFAWENDVMAYRIYHSDLIPVDGPSGGIDVWAKRTKDMVIDTWFEHMDYHTDHGQGCDSYKVGPTLGAGSIALLEDGKIKTHANYTNAKIIAQGPIRLIAEFSFAEQEIQGKKVTTMKTLSLDAGSSLNKFDVIFDSELQDLELVTGIAKRKDKGQICMNEQEGYLMYWEPENAPFGHTGLGIIMPKSANMGTLDNQLVAYGIAKSQKAFTYYSGACWSTAAYFKSPKDWKSYLQNFKRQLKQPLEITVE